MAAMRSRGVLLSQKARSSLMDESFFKSNLLTVLSIISIPRASYGRCQFEPCRTERMRFPNTDPWQPVRVTRQERTAGENL